MNEVPKGFQNQIAFFYPTDYKPEERPIVNFEFNSLPAMAAIRFHVTVFAASLEDNYNASLTITTSDGTIVSTTNTNWQVITATGEGLAEPPKQILSTNSFVITPPPFKVVENTVGYRANLVLLGKNINTTATTYFTTHLNA